ncbi:MAG: PAS domain S-box protein [Gammaproteobacteria bacterium]|nr:MAG: PAS domain S-box protein [Gammaproteobacteria bacterium]
MEYVVVQDDSLQLGTSTDAILESISDGVFTVDLDWRITSFNRAAAEITGVSKDEAIGRLCSEVFCSDMCESACALRKTFRTQKPVINQSGYIIDSSGIQVPISVSTALLRNSDGDVIGGAETFRDLSEVETLKSELKESYSFGSFVTHSPVMRNVIETAKAVADSPTTVLVTGETGSGKELLAKSIHESSPNSSEPFVAVNCGALLDSLLESELFGYKKGAFTGAYTNKLGRFAAAGKGTLFLDEIGEISPAMQVKLLRVLQEGTFEPLGSNKTEKSKARIIAATHRDLAQMVRDGKFRQDLYYRINVITLNIPPLRERKEDIPHLADHFLNKFNQIQNKKIRVISPEVYSVFLEHNWEGNIRELENVIERAVVLSGDDEINKSHIPHDLISAVGSGADISSHGIVNIKSAVESNEKEMILKSLQDNKYNRNKTAESLGIHKTTLYRKMIKYSIEV